MKPRSFFFAPILLSCFMLNANGQAPAISSEAIVARVKAAGKVFGSVPYRTFTAIESVGESDPNAVTRLTTEIIPPNRRRLLQENNLPGTFKTKEIINIDDRNYVRLDYQAWRRVSTRELTGPVQPAPAEKVPVKSKITETGKFIERTAIDGRIVDVFELHLENADIERGEIRVTATRRVWLREDGYLVKDVTEYNRAGEKRTNRTTRQYEYDNISIEEPNVPTEN